MEAWTSTRQTTTRMRDDIAKQISLRTRSARLGILAACSLPDAHEAVEEISKVTEQALTACRLADTASDNTELTLLLSAERRMLESVRGMVDSQRDAQVTAQQKRHALTQLQYALSS